MWKSSAANRRNENQVDKNMTKLQQLREGVVHKISNQEKILKKMTEVNYNMSKKVEEVSEVNQWLGEEL